MTDPGMVARWRFQNNECGAARVAGARWIGRWHPRLSGAV